MLGKQAHMTAICFYLFNLKRQTFLTIPKALNKQQIGTCLWKIILQGAIVNKFVD